MRGKFAIPLYVMISWLVLIALIDSTFVDIVLAIGVGMGGFALGLVTLGAIVRFISS